MCFAERCCYWFNLDVGSLIVGVIALILSTVITVMSTVFLYDWDKVANIKAQSPSPDDYSLSYTVQQIMSDDKTKIVLRGMIVVGVMWMASSIMLMIGVSKRKPGMVLVYFGFGILVTILCQLGALLIMLAMHWILALVVFIVSLIHIHYLVVIHTVYERMLRGLSFDNLHQKLDEESLVDVNDVSA